MRPSPVITEEGGYATVRQTVIFQTYVANPDGGYMIKTSYTELTAPEETTYVQVMTKNPEETISTKAAILEVRPSCQGMGAVDATMMYYNTTPSSRRKSFPVLFATNVQTLLARLRHAPTRTRSPKHSVTETSPMGGSNSCWTEPSSRR